MSLVQTIGTARFNERFGGCFFTGPDGEAHILGNASGRMVLCTKVMGVVGNLTTQEVTVADTFFDDMARFRVPMLGWRSAQGGRILNRITRTNRGYHRGVALSNVDIGLSEMTQSLVNDRLLSVNYMRMEAVVAQMVFSQEYLTLAQGLEKMRNGELLSFCISPNLAVAAHTDDECAIYHMADIVGSVTIDGVVSARNPFVIDALQEAA